MPLPVWLSRRWYEASRVGLDFSFSPPSSEFCIPRQPSSRHEPWRTLLLKIKGESIQPTSLLIAILRLSRLLRLLFDTHFSILITFLLMRVPELGSFIPPDALCPFISERGRISVTWHTHLHILQDCGRSNRKSEDKYPCPPGSRGQGVSASPDHLTSDQKRKRKVTSRR